MTTFTFREVPQPGGLLFEAEDDDSLELMGFLGYTRRRINEERFDKVYEWLTKIGHKVDVLAARPTTMDF